jgi:hypothetical protein
MSADQRETAYATLQVTGDRLDPPEVTAVLGLKPTFCVRKGETFRRGRRDREYVGRTGVWSFSTKGTIHSDRLQDHLASLGELLLARQERFVEIREFLRGHSEWAGVSCFWAGPAQAAQPSVPEWFRELVGRIGGEIEVDFYQDDAAEEQTAAE